MVTGTGWAQRVTLSRQHGFCTASFTLSMSVEDAEGSDSWAVRYTLDSSTPTASSPEFVEPLIINGNTIVRAAAFAGELRMTDITTATYLFVDDILNQGNAPDGYPSKWGKYTQISGTAIADYGMDTVMTKDTTLAPIIREGLQSLPVLSIVTDKENLFSHENNEETGGIYIFTGPPVGDATGHGWTRPASIELIGGEQAHDLSTTCGLRLHGGHGRLAEKNPKHSFRLVFKEKYGPKTLKYPIFGPEEPAKFDQLVLRCHFGNSWQHWSESNRQKAQYTRDVWARLMQRKMGRTSVNALYVNLFINGMYWGLYNIAERVDDQFGKNHLGGDKTDIDVIRVEEDGGNHLEAAAGDMEAWNLMVKTAARAADDAAYLQLDTLLDIDSFIDYMLINQYAGNTDWDHHNWYAVRRRGPDSEGFRFLCWDTELIFDNVNENVLSKNNGRNYPTGIFQNLMKNAQFARRYLKRALIVLADDGPLGQASSEQLWDSLYHDIETAIYAESARWGDYRRDVHPYNSKGHRYTVGKYYLKERQRLHDEYFPIRSGRVLSSIISFVNIDDLEALEQEILGMDTPVIVPSFDDRYYNLQGQPVTFPTPGLYIHHGKKVLIR
ncbi:MAG: CotH kinase family protein [Bacteroidaceae bacterium]|nr:CotH kinase family protein [Bacteroidaceae bacterium]